VGASSAKSGLTKLELRIMQVIWKRGSSTVAEVQAEMRPPLAYTTVQTVLNILERKGKLERELDGRAYVYAAKVSEEKAYGQSLRDLIDRMFGGSSEELVMSLLKSRQIDAKRLAKLTEQFSKEKGSGA
jgi:predicted transcriptional regulator